ncbi:MAG: ABC transporter ATP-binding protein [Ilumatobacter sp.]|uniref:ABC transporter ATP-binding protein n=1 Tax=Ilumatobacter sp. TaxID=1967498 RepID=UPI00261B274E|nr:ABC transporter ATP-binding protein [Ilumatobacter sp.]MDJ0767927.1 ABC transporter ATP-binding protein [Ilumatobacter sp.]
MTAVEARAVTRRFGTFTAVDRVDLDVGPGEIVGLIGANGAGKTTLIKMLLGVLTPTSGSVRMFGRPHSLALRRRIGYVPQNLGLYTDLSATENLDFRAQIFGAAPGTVAASSAVGDGFVGSMSLGAQRVVAFRAATQHAPDLLILDEPTSGVSPLARSELWDLVHRAAEQGAAVLVSTHHLDEAEQADRLVIMSRGNVVADGTAAGITGDGQIVAVESDHWDAVFRHLDTLGCRLRLDGRVLRVLGTSVDAVGTELGRAGLEARVSSRPANLEEVLIELDAAPAPTAGTAA